LHRTIEALPGQSPMLKEITLIDSPLTINEFCAAEKISRGMFYKLLKQDKGPRLYFIGNRPRITPEARAEWRQNREAEATSAVAA
jgi:hypothetical protein